MSFKPPRGGVLAVMQVATPATLYGRGSLARMVVPSAPLSSFPIARQPPPRLASFHSTRRCWMSFFLTPLRSAYPAAVVFLGLLQQPAAALDQSNPAPALRLNQATASAENPTSIRIILVEWRIKKGRENEFLEYWSTRSTVPDRAGLIAEFLNRVESREQFPWIRLGFR